MKPETSKNAVSNVVSDLIRAAAGSSAKNVSDADVDKYVADLILKEAEEKRKKYNLVGVKAYQPNGMLDKPKPKPNTRFLLNMVKATDSHNQMVIKANEDNVAMLRRERLKREEEKAKKLRDEREDERRLRRHSISSSKRSSRHDRDNRDDRKRHKSREEEEKESSHHRDHKKHKSSSSKHHHHYHHHRDDKNDKSLDPVPTKEPVQYKGRGKVRIDVSSMDKYFSKGYDPLLDIDSDEDNYVFAKEDSASKKKRKHKKSSKKKKKKSHKHWDEPSSSSSSSSEEEEPAPKPVRAWDVGKM